MPLPHWTREGILPPGRHSADLADIYERLVCDAPNTNEREILFGALSSYLGVVAKVIPTGRALIGGNFAIRTTDAPEDVDVVLVPDDWGSLKRLDSAGRAALYGLLTLHGVIIGQPPMYLERVRPVGGALDSFLCHPGDEDVWESALTESNGRARGFLEVTW